MSIFERTDLLIGRENREKLNNSSVAVFGIGGVGSYVCEALARAGIGRLLLVDSDSVSESNINRQIIALQSTVGQPKTQVMAERIADINPEISVETKPIFFSAETADSIDFSEFSYVVDAVDTVTAKLLIIEKAKAAGVPVISSMGTGNKMSPFDFKIADISKTSVCPLARVMRYELKKRGIKNVRVLYSTEEPKVSGSRTPASISFVPSAAGLMIASEVIKDIIEKE